MTNLRSPRARWRKANPMAEYDSLCPDLRRWLAQAALPWSAGSALRLWQRALAATGCPKAAWDHMTRAEQRSLARHSFFDEIAGKQDNVSNLRR